VKVSTRGDYASRALLSLALHADESGPTSVRDIAERTGLPQPYLEQILLALKGAGVVRSKRGVGGGYVLARPPDQIRLSEILSAVDGPITLGDFGEPHQNGACDHEGQCVLLAIWKQSAEVMRHHLEGFTLASMPLSPRVRRSGRPPSSRWQRRRQQRRLRQLVQLLQRGQTVSQVGRKRALEGDPLPGLGMLERQLGGVQERAFEL
jgi:Rrf2 family iron-sulfur cluster assembly transcriptional regulator